MLYIHIRAYLLGTILLIFSIGVYGQNKVENTFKKPTIRVKTSVQQGKVLLRWAVDQPAEWQKANKYGFKIERYQIREDKKLTKVLLTPQPIKPQELDKWQNIVQKDDNAAIIAQSLFGKTFSINENSNTPKNMSDVLRNTDEIKMRYSFALLAADMNFEAACMAGWGFVDSTVESDKEYFYYISVASNKAKVNIDTGIAIINTRQINKIPSPALFKGQFSNKKVSLTWDNQWQKDIFTSYILERSEDSIHFKKVTEKPIINMVNSGEEMELMRYNDTLPQNDKPYYYRLRGITCFGELSPYTSIIRGIGRESMSFAPNITEAEVINDSTINIKWQIRTDSTIQLLSSFELGISGEADGQYKTVKTGINKNARLVTYKGAISTQYFILSAIDKNGEKYSSLPFLVQAIDSTPPAIPIGLEGFIDSLGIVQLKWKDNTDHDILGYQVFRGNLADDEMSLINTDPLSISHFSDTLSAHLGNEKVYYAIAAVDQRYNQSKLSAKIEITKPDKTPPIAPVFKDFVIGDKQVDIYWENGASEDVISHRLYKKVFSANTLNDNNEGWDLLKELSSLDTTSYRDTSVIEGTIVGYTLMAVDKNKNESAPSTPLTVNIPFNKKNKDGVKELHAVVDRKSKKILIEWTYTEKDVVEYQIYKSNSKAPMSLWKVAQKTTAAIIDEDISPSNIYKYAVRAVFKNGAMSQWKEIAIEF